MARGYRNLNPGNIRQSRIRYKGEVHPSTDTHFKQFETMAWGFRAMFVLLDTYRVRYGLKTLQQMIERYAPPSENDTTGYVNFITRRTRIADISTVDTLNEKQMIPLVTAMAVMENGTEPDAEDVHKGWVLFISHKCV